MIDTCLSSPSDLIYDVLRAHEPDHVLLRATYADAGSGLLDIARLRGVDHFDDAYPITGDDLELAVTKAGINVEPGDALVVRTGQMHFLRAGDRQRYSVPSPGLSTQSIEWLRACLSGGRAGR